MAELGYEPSFTGFYCKEVILVKYMMREVMCCSFFFFKGVTEVQRSIPAQAGMGSERVSGKQELVS